MPTAALSASLELHMQPMRGPWRPLILTIEPSLALGASAPSGLREETVRKFWVVLGTLVLLVNAPGCAKHWKNGECETSDNCKEQEGYGKICVQGHCQECGADTDCKAGFVCKENRCVPRPECDTSKDCPTGKMCNSGRCVVDPDDCTSGIACSGGRECVQGRCVARAATPLAKGPCDELQSVYFAYDSAVLSDNAREALQHDVRCLTSQNIHLMVEGNCDERGTTEYNLHLGQRRAESVKRYLHGLGLASKKIETVSYGKERPVCTESTDTCWQKNRRGDVRIK